MSVIRRALTWAQPSAVGNKACNCFLLAVGFVGGEPGVRGEAGEAAAELEEAGEGGPREARRVAEAEVYREVNREADLGAHLKVQRAAARAAQANISPRTPRAASVVRVVSAGSAVSVEAGTQTTGGPAIPSMDPGGGSVGFSIDSQRLQRSHWGGTI